MALATALTAAALSPLFKEVFDRLISSKAVTDNFGRKKRRIKLLEKLDVTMLPINKVIHDAEKKEITDQYVKEWLDKLKDAILDAEDVLDVISSVNQAHDMKTGICRLISKVRPWNPFDTTIDKELDNVIQRFELLFQKQVGLGLKESHLPNSELVMATRVQTTSLVVESDVYGRNVDKERITELLLSNKDQSNVSVIAIVGMGGIGKTTLAQLVFNSDEVKKHFAVNKVWICVSEDYDITRITKNILHKLTLQSYDTNDLDLLQTKLKETLSAKKFLIVLDDVWNQDDMDWDILRKPFNFVAPGSKIIVTTRNTRVARAMGALSPYKLEVLSDEDCWSLFAKHAFESIPPSSHSKFEVVGRKLVKKCKGLPLAARVLGGLLRTKVANAEEWDEVLNNDIWNSSEEESENKILPVLRLSYHYLPSKLKQCFGFCSLIPKDFEFEREKIVMLWMAESLLSVRGGKKTKRDIGYEYLRDLESRSLIQPSRIQKSHFGMHDLVNDLATVVSGDFYKSFDFGNSFEVGKQTRHISFVIPNKFKESDFARLKVISEAKRLRGLMPLEDKQSRATLLPFKILRPLKLIRTLVLSNSNMKELPSFIGNLKLLHYLDLSNSYKLIQLPESLASLYNLEVLILSGCECLIKLPSKMRQLIKLNVLNVTSTKLEKMPLQMGCLKDLYMLTDFVVGKGSGSSIAEMKELKDLRGKVSICGLQNITDPKDALEANLKGKSYLEELDLIWDSYFENTEDATIILDNLRPHISLKKLLIIGYSGTRFPDWSGMANLVSISVCDFKYCFHFSPLGQLPSLKYLSIHDCDSLATLLGNEIHHHVGHFSALVELNISQCPKLELPQHHHFTSIEDFTLDGNSCDSLQSYVLSSFPKLKNLLLCKSSLESLEVIDNITLEYLKAIQIRNCPNFEYFNAEKWCAPMMTDLELRNCESLKVLPENMCNIFPSLESLSLDQCPNLEALPKSGLPGNLRTLKIKGCNKLMTDRSSWGLQKLLSLSYLTISKFECDDLESFPEEALLPSSLSTLCLEHVPNLTNLNGKSFELLTLLKTLQLIDCPKLQCLPKLPTSMSSLIIRFCLLLTSRCQKEQGEDWKNIAHIPNINVL